MRTSPFSLVTHDWRTIWIVQYGMIWLGPCLSGRRTCALAPLARLRNSLSAVDSAQESTCVREFQCRCVGTIITAHCPGLRYTLYKKIVRTLSSEDRKRRLAWTYLELLVKHQLPNEVVLMFHIDEVVRCLEDPCIVETDCHRLDDPGSNISDIAAARSDGVNSPNHNRDFA